MTPTSEDCELSAFLAEEKKKKKSVRCWPAPAPTGCGLVHCAVSSLSVIVPDNV